MSNHIKAGLATFATIALVIGVGTIFFLWPEALLILIATAAFAFAVSVTYYAFVELFRLRSSRGDDE